MTVVQKLPNTPKLIRQQMLTGEFARNVWCIAVPEGMTAADLLKSETYVHIAAFLKQGDRLEALAPDGSWFAEFIVRAAGGGEVETGQLSLIKFDEIEGLADSPYAPKYSGNKQSKWRVLRRSDGHVMIEGLESKSAAFKWIEDTFPVKAAA